MRLLLSVGNVLADVILLARAASDRVSCFVSAAGRALRLLERLADAGAPLSSRELAAATDIPRSTLSDLLVELRSLGYVQQANGRYGPGVALTLLGYKVSQSLGAPEALRQTLEQLAAQTGETALYSVGIGGDAPGMGRVLIVGQIPSGNPIRYVARPLPPRLMTETASGRVLLAFSDRKPEHPPELAEELELTRRQGYFVNVASSGATSIAAPVFDAPGHLAGALAVTGPSDRMTHAERRIWPTLRAAARSLHP